VLAEDDWSKTFPRFAVRSTAASVVRLPGLLRRSGSTGTTPESTVARPSSDIPNLSPLGGGHCSAAVEKPVKWGVKKMHDTLLLLEYDLLGPISATAVEKI
jgi:hypothetical protein